MYPINKAACARRPAQALAKNDEERRSRASHLS